MANRYWVGGSGTWASTGTTNWSASSGGASGASAPTTADAVIFDANSNTGTNDFTVTLGTNPACLTLNTTGIDPATAMTVAGTGTLTVAGTAFTLTNKVAWTHTGTVTFTLAGASTCNVTTAGVALTCNISVALGSTTTILNLVDDLTTTGSLTFSQGNLDSTGSNKTLTVAALLTSATTSKIIRLGASATVNITGNNRTVIDFVTGTNLNFQTPSIVNLTYSGSTGTRTIAGGNGLNTKTVNVLAGSDTLTFSSGLMVALDFTGFTGTWTNAAISVGALTLTAGMTVGAGANTVTFFRTGTVTTNGKTLDFPITASSGGITITLADNLTMGSTRLFTLTQATLVLGSNTLTAGSFSSTGTSTRSVTRTTGNITLTGNGATVLALTGSNATYGAGLVFTCNYSGSTGTRTFNVTDVNPEIDITAGSDIVTFTANNSVGNLDFTGFSGTWSNVVMSLASLTLSTGMTVTAGANTVTFARTGTVTSNGKTLDFPVTINGAGITTTIGDTLSIGTTRNLSLAQGTLNFNNQNASLGTFTSNVAFTRVLTLGSGTITVNGSGTDAWVNVGATVTANTATIRMTSASAKRFAGGGSTWHVLENAGAGALTISNNNTFTTISNSVQPATFTFTAGTTQTVTNFNVNGTAGNLVTIQSSTAGTQATLSKASGIVSVNYCSLKDSNATGGASWYAETALGNVDAGNNTGWLFARINYLVTANNGTYAVTGQAADLSKTKVIFADNGSYALAGQTASLLKTRILTADNGAYAVTGQTASLLRSKVVTANNGVYTTTGIGATIDKSRLFTADPGFYAVTGEQAGISWSGAPIVVSEEFLIKLRSFTERRRF